VKKIDLRPLRCFYQHMIKKIVSGGQTGADRGGLDAAIYCHIPHGGWCPKGRLAEDTPIPERYQLTETRSKDYLRRTEQNVIDSDCTLVFTYGPPSRGTKRTIQFTEKHGRSCQVVDLKVLNSEQAVDGIVAWLNGQIEEHEYPAPPRHPVLNVAGPRESNIPGIADKVCAIVVQVLIRTNPDCRRHYPMTVPEEGGSHLPEIAELLAASEPEDDGEWRADGLQALDGVTGLVLDAALFANRRKKMVKALYWDGDGFVIWSKRPERERFRIGEQKTLDRASPAMILDGLHAEQVRRLPRYRK